MNVAGALLPKLDRLTGLTALNLSENMLAEVPQQLGKLGSLRFLDLSLNVLLRVRFAFLGFVGVHPQAVSASDGNRCKAPNSAYGVQ